MPRSTGNTGSKWFRCGLCGRHYPESYKARQRGIYVCTYLPCVDEPGGQSGSERDPRVAEPPETTDEQVRR